MEAIWNHYSLSFPPKKKKLKTRDYTYWLPVYEIYLVTSLVNDQKYVFSNKRMQLFIDQEMQKNKKNVFTSLTALKIQECSGSEFCSVIKMTVKALIMALCFDFSHFLYCLFHIDWIDLRVYFVNFVLPTFYFEAKSCDDAVKSLPNYVAGRLTLGKST